MKYSGIAASRASFWTSSIRPGRSGVASVGEDHDRAAALLLAQLANRAGHGVIQRGAAIGLNAVERFRHRGAVGGQRLFAAGHVLHRGDAAAIAVLQRAGDEVRRGPRGVLHRIHHAGRGVEDEGDGDRLIERLAELDDPSFRCFVHDPELGAINVRAGVAVAIDDRYEDRHGSHLQLFAVHVSRGRPEVRRLVAGLRLRGDLHESGRGD